MYDQQNNCYLGINGKQYGPLSGADIQKMYDNGEITGDTKFIRVGMKEWINLSESDFIIPLLPDEDNGIPPLPNDERSPPLQSKITTQVATYEPHGENAANSDAVPNPKPKKSKGKKLAGIAVIAFVAITVIALMLDPNPPSTPSGGGNSGGRSSSARSGGLEGVWESELITHGRAQFTVIHEYRGNEWTSTTVSARTGEPDPSIGGTFTISENYMMKVEEWGARAERVGSTAWIPVRFSVSGDTLIWDGIAFTRIR